MVYITKSAQNGQITIEFLNLAAFLLQKAAVALQKTQCKGTMVN